MRGPACRGRIPARSGMSHRAISGHASGAALRWRWCKTAAPGMASGSGRRFRTARSRRGSARRCFTIPTARGAMAETRHSPLEDLLPWALPAEGDNPAVSLSELRFARQIGLRLRPPMPAYIGGVPLPLQPNRVAVMRGVRTLWLGPDEWLITAAGGAAPALLGC